MFGDKLITTIIRGEKTMVNILVFLIALVAGLGTIQNRVESGNLSIKRLHQYLKNFPPLSTFSMGDFFCNQNNKPNIPNEKKST